MKLYYNPLSTYSQKVLIAFNEKGLSYEPQVVDLASAEARKAYEKVYPLGKVPFLQASDDWRVPESTSIIEYLEDKFPKTPRLIPAAGGDAARQVRFVDRQADLYLHEPIGELRGQATGWRAQDKERAAQARKQVTFIYGNLERRLAGQQWLCGDSFTMADCAAIPPLYFAQGLVSFESYPNITAYWKRAQKRPSYARVLAEFEPMWKKLTKQRPAA